MSAPVRDRAPAPGPKPSFAPPALVRASLANGIPAVLVDAPRLPFAMLQVSVAAGHRFVPPEQCGRAALLADVLAEGTERLDGTALQEELDGLGATLDVHADDDEITVELLVLERHQERGAELLAELVAAPRFAPDAVARAQRQRISELRLRAGDPGALAADAWRAVLFGAGTSSGRPPAGTPESVAALTRDGLAEAWSAALDPARLRLVAVGPLGSAPLERFAPLAECLAPAAPRPERTDPAPALGAGRRITLVDRPGAPQTHLRVGHLSIAATHADFYPLVALNHPLGGAFSSRLNLNLREQKGWTYGIRSGFTGGLTPGWFQVGAAVETGVTLPAVREILLELERFRADGVTEGEVEFARLSLSQTLYGQYEPAGAKAAFAGNVGKYGWPADYPLRRLAWLERMTRGELDALARRHLALEALEIVCVGDARRLLPELEQLGLPVAAWPARAAAGA